MSRTFDLVQWHMIAKLSKNGTASKTATRTTPGKPLRRALEEATKPVASMHRGTRCVPPVGISGFARTRQPPFTPLCEPAKREEHHEQDTETNGPCRSARLRHGDATSGGIRRYDAVRPIRQRRAVHQRKAHHRMRRGHGDVRSRNANPCTEQRVHHECGRLWRHQFEADGRFDHYASRKQFHHP